MLHGIQKWTGGHQMSEIKLKPCPFCGSEKLQGVEYAYVCYIKCRNCGATGAHYIMNGDKAIDAWNRRVGERNETVKGKLKAGIDINEY